MKIREFTGFSLPDKKRGIAFFNWNLAWVTCFIIMYGSMNWITSKEQSPLQLFFEWELSIPFLPGFIWIYLSIVFIFFVPLFFSNVNGIRYLGPKMLWATFTAGILFWLFPAEAGYVRSDTIADQYLLFRILYFFDHYPHNLFPSLHITYSAILVFSMLTSVKTVIKWLLWIWFLVICLSVFVVHQHHLVDVAGGVLLALAIHMLSRHGSKPILKNEDNTG
ncbi:MAG: phosphatase PAP2 family protein [Leptospirales bacterium]